MTDNGEVDPIDASDRAHERQQLLAARRSRGIPLLPPSDPDDWSVLGGLSYELYSTLRPPFELLQVVFFNMALVLAGWFLLGPDSITSERFASIVFLPAILASWAFSDVPATNLYGSQPDRALKALGHPTRLHNLILGRDLALWTLIAPAGAILSLLLALKDNETTTTLLVTAFVLIMPLGYLGIAAIAAPLLPYHSVPMKQRLQLRKTWLRWGFAVILPFLLSTPVAVLLLAPALALVEVFGKEPWVFLVAGVVVLGWTALVRRLAVRYTVRLTFRREDKLRAYLSDPTLG